MASITLVGGSLGGLMAANMLLRAGHAVTVLEKATGSLDGRGAGIVTHRPLVAALAQCGIAPDAALGVAIDQRVVLGADGCVLARATMPQVLTSWSRLYALLLAAFPAKFYVQAASVIEVKQTASDVTAICVDGRGFKSDILIASDGIRSPVRAQLAPEVKVNYAGYVAWRGVCDEAVLSQNTLDTVFNTFGFGLPPGEQLIGYPVAGAENSVRVGARRYNFVWYRPAPDDGSLQALMTDADGHHHARGLPPHKVSWKHIAQARQDARNLLAPQFAEILEKTAQPFLQPIYDCWSEQVAFGRVALMGDAAFVARPHVGMGVTKAAQDAVALADCVQKHGASPEALQRYQSARLLSGQSVVQRARRLGAYMQGQANAEPMQRNVRDVMMETAIDLSPAQQVTEAEMA
jgi:2-polyprenyl-6-methoxyphenol hydroxylase-like FAD-dependent oxidoreductase